MAIYNLLYFELEVPRHVNQNTNANFTRPWCYIYLSLGISQGAASVAMVILKRLNYVYSAVITDFDCVLT